MKIRKQTYSKLVPLYNDNASKLLECEGGRKCFIYMRDRNTETAYYTLRVKGNYITAYKTQWVIDGKGLNLFLDIAIPTLCGEISPHPVEVRTLLCKTKIKDWEEFSRLFKEATPTLHWFES